MIIIPSSLLGLRGTIVGFTLTRIRADFHKALLNFGQIELETPVPSNMKDKQSKSWRAQLNQFRRRVETTIGQLVERFMIEMNWAGTVLSLTNKFIRLHFLSGSRVKKQA